MLVLLAGEPDQLEVLPGLPVALAACDAAHAQAEFDIAERGEPRIKRIVALEDDAAIGARPVDRRTANPDVARGGPFEARDHVEDRGLAAAAGAQQAEELARFDVEREVAHGLVIPAPH